MYEVRWASENEVISGIIKFDKFYDFYPIERESRKEIVPIDWAINPSKCLKFNLYAYKGTNPLTGNSAIVLPRLPATHNEAYIVAHEIMHVIRKFDGLELPIRSRKKSGIMEDIISRIGSMFDDPLIDSILQDKYNLNPAFHYTEIDMPRSIEILKSFPTERQDDTSKILLLLYHASQLLLWDGIKDINALEKCREYQEFYRSTHPIMAKMGEELYSIVKENGYDTFDKQRRLFDIIANKYTIDGIKLSNILYLE